MEDVYKMYIDNNCNLEGMRDDILKAMDINSRKGEYDKKDEGNWIDVSIVVEDNDVVSSCASSSSVRGEGTTKYCSDGKGIKLETKQCPGEGPFASKDTWNVVQISGWAVGKSYYFEVANYSPCDLSCEITIDGIAFKVAKNAPIPAKSSRTIKTDNGRYFQTHKWSFQPSQRVPLQNCVLKEGEIVVQTQQEVRETIQECST